MKNNVTGVREPQPISALFYVLSPTRGVKKRGQSSADYLSGRLRLLTCLRPLFLWSNVIFQPVYESCQVASGPAVDKTATSSLQTPSPPAGGNRPEGQLLPKTITRWLPAPFHCEFFILC